MSKSAATWPLVPLADVGRWFGGGTPTKNRTEFWANGSVPWLSPKDMGADVITSTQDRITPAAIEGSSARLVPANSVAIVVRSGILERKVPIGLVPFEVTLNQDMKAVVPRDGIDPRWVAWGLRAMERDVLRECRKAGTTVASIETVRLMARRLPVPPIDEQRRIVEILEEHLSRLDAADAYLNASARRTSALRLSALTQLRQSFIDDGTEVRCLGEMAATALGKMLDAKRAVGTPTPYLRNINVRWGTFDTGDLSTVQLTEPERSALALRRGDLMVCEGGEPGRCAVWPGSESLLAYQKALHRVRVLDEERVDVAFVALMLEEYVRSGRAGRMFTGTTIKHLPQEKLRLIDIPVPHLGRQRAAVVDLGALEVASVRVQAESETARTRGRALRRALLHAAFTGRLTGHASDTDRAEELAATSS